MICVYNCLSELKISIRLKVPQNTRINLIKQNQQLYGNNLRYVYVAIKSNLLHYTSLDVGEKFMNVDTLRHSFIVKHFYSPVSLALSKYMYMSMKEMM